MIKKITYIILLLTFFGCDSPGAPDCLRTVGSIVQEEISVPEFTKIVIEDDVTLVIKQGEIQRVIIESGENLIDDVSAIVEGETLRVRNSAHCELVREYGVTRVIVTAPNITRIRNSSAFDVLGEGILAYPRLVLVSNTTGGVDDPKKSGDFRLTIHCENLDIQANGQSGFYIDGFTAKATIAFEDEAPRFEGENLEINELVVFQRSANKMIVNPLESIRGRIFATGDIIAVNRPPIVEVEEFFTGRLIFQD